MIPYIKDSIVSALSKCYISNDERAICSYIWEHNGTFVATTGYLAVKVELKMTTDVCDFELQSAAYDTCCGIAMQDLGEGWVGTQFDILKNFNKIIDVMDKSNEAVDSPLCVNPGHLITLINAVKKLGCFNPTVKVCKNKIEVCGQTQFFIIKGVLMALADIQDDTCKI